MVKTFELSKRQIEMCIGALLCLDSEWGLSGEEEELLVELELALED